MAVSGNLRRLGNKYDTGKAYKVGLYYIYCKKENNLNGIILKMIRYIFLTHSYLPLQNLLLSGTKRI